MLCLGQNWSSTEVDQVAIMWTLSYQPCMHGFRNIGDELYSVDYILYIKPCMAY